MKLTRADPVYRGQTATHFGRGTRASSIPYPVALTVQIHPTKAIGEDQAWAATAFAGTIVMSFQYSSTGAFYCPASTVKGSLAGASV
jgi:hypothetical protein